MSAVFEIMGTTGSFIICASAIPQVVKTCRIKRSRDFSIAYLGALMLGISLLQSYSLYVRDFVFIIGNTLSMLSTGLLIVLWFRYGARGKRQQARGKDNNKELSNRRPAVVPSTSLPPTLKLWRTGRHDKLAGQAHASKEISLTEQTSFLHNLQELS
jgi:uncharacterized protein with PQ loop repeat